MTNLYIIEARVNGALDFADPQPESVFGMGAITGIDEDAMAKRIFNKVPEAALTGGTVSQWPTFIDPRWVARRKTW